MSGQLELAVGRGECVGLQRVGAVGVALDDLRERVALELGAQVHAGRAGQVVEPVAVLELLQLRLEDVVEAGAQQATEQVGHLGEATDPEVDVVQARDGVSVGGVRPGVPNRLNMKSAASAGWTSVGSGSTIARAASRLALSVVALVQLTEILGPGYR